MERAFYSTHLWRGSNVCFRCSVLRRKAGRRWEWRRVYASDHEWSRTALLCVPGVK